MILPYIVNVALILFACLAFYKVLLRRETFYKVNRYMLIVCLVISFILPLLRVPQQFSLHKVNVESSVLNKQQATSNIQPTTITTDKSTPATTSVQPDVQISPIGNNLAQSPSNKLSFAQLMNWLFWIYWFGVIIFGISFLLQLAVLLWRSYRNPVIIDGPYRIVEVRGDKAPCSFGNTIFINPEKYDWETYSQILLHEKIHIRQKHTIDILIAELLLIFQWFNPFAWVYRREIESNLEFLTDDQLTQNEKIDKQQYQLSLVQVSAPHFPLSLTTNYNQSILKKRIAMMNIKRSNLHTAWKYFFLLPVFAFLACLLNEPIAYGQNGQSNKATEANNEKGKHNHDIETEGSWFATIKGEKISIQFKRDDDIDNNSFSGNTYKLSELSSPPKEGQTSFKITRDAGTVEFTGMFQGNTGMGHYKFVADKTYADQLSNELKEKLDDRNMLVFFFVNVKKGFVSMLKDEGYTNVTKEDLIPVAALGVDQAYIRSVKNAGFKDVSLEKLVSLKALGVDDKYIAEIRSAYKNISTDQLVSFKAQGIDKEYIGKVREMKGNKDDNDADDMVSFKAMNITPEYINSFKAVGLTNIPHEALVSFKAVGVTPEYIKSWHDMGFKNIEPEHFVGMKSQNVTPEFMKSFVDMGYKNINPEHLVSFRALGITSEYVKSFETAGYKITDLDNVTGLKAQGITPEFIKSFESVGFKNIDLDEIVAVKAMGITPEYIKDMKAKGFNYNSIQKYITLKSID